MSAQLHRRKSLLRPPALILLEEIRPPCAYSPTPLPDIETFRSYLCSLLRYLPHCQQHRHPNDDNPIQAGHKSYIRPGEICSHHRCQHVHVCVQGQLFRQGVRRLYRISGGLQDAEGLICVVRSPRQSHRVCIIQPTTPHRATTRQTSSIRAETVLAHPKYRGREEQNSAVPRAGCDAAFQHPDSSLGIRSI